MILDHYFYNFTLLFIKKDINFFSILDFYEIDDQFQTNISIILLLENNLANISRKIGKMQMNLWMA